MLILYELPSDEEAISLYGNKDLRC
jgi:hypothetical protein